MPSGDKVGDGYIEITPDLNTAKLDAAMARVKASMADLDKTTSKSSLDSTKTTEDSRSKIVEQHLKDLLAKQKDFEKAKVDAEKANDKLGVANHATAEAEKTATTIRENEKRLKEDVDSAKKAASSTHSFLSTILSPLPGHLETILPASPELGAALAASAAGLGGVAAAAFGAALLTSVGLLDLGAGIALAIGGDKELEAAGSRLGHHVLTGLEHAASVLDKPIQVAIENLGATFDKILPDIHQGFANLAPAILPLEQGLATFATQFAEGFSSLSVKLEPLLATFGEKVLPMLSHGLELFLSLSATDVGGLSSALQGLAGFIEGVLIDMGALVLAGVEISRVITDVVIAAFYTLGYLLEGISHLLPGFGGGVHNAGKEMIHLGDSAKGTFDTMAAGVQPVETLGGKVTALSSSLGHMTSSAGLAAAAQAALRTQVDAAEQSVKKETDGLTANNEAAEAWNTDLLNLKDSLKQNGATLDIHTKSGLANRDSLEAAAQASQHLFEEDIASGVPVSEATQRAKDRTSALLDQFGKTGALRDQTQQLIDKYGAIPTDVKTLLQLEGYDDVNGKLDNLLIDQYALTKGVSVAQAQKDSGLGGGPLQGHAAGGYIWGPGGPTDDAIPAWLSNGEYVINAKQTAKHGPLIEAINQDKPLPGYAAGGPVTANWPFPIDVSKTVIPDIYTGGGAGTAGVLGWLTSIAAHLPYVFGAVGPNAFDCSGLVGEVWARLTGHGINTRYFTTANEPSWLAAHGFLPGPGGVLTVGMSSEHTMGQIAGLNFEAQNPTDGIHVGSGTSSISSFPTIMHLEAPGGSTPGGSVPTGQLGAWIAAASKYVNIEWPAGLATLINRESGGNPNAWNPSGATGLMQTKPGTFEQYRNTSLPDVAINPISDIVAGMNYIHSRYGSLHAVQQAHAELPPMGYDNGGYLQPGWNLAYNGLGVPEAVRTPDQERDSHRDIHVYVHDDQVKGLVRAELGAHDKALVDALYKGSGK